jgi:MYXO-CTERM domain-containing protein
VTPLPQGFPTANRIENAATVRLTDSGLGFLNDNLTTLVGKFGGGLLTNGVLEQGIPMTSTKLGPITANICPQGSDPMGTPKKCLLQADIGNSKLTLSPAAPHALKLSGTLETLIQYLNIDVPLVGGISAPIQVSLGQGVNGDGSSSNYSAVPIEVDISIEADTDTTHQDATGNGRTGLSRVKIAKFDLTPSKDDLHISGKCSIPIVCDVWDAVIGGVGGLVKGLLIDQLKAPLQSQIDNALCIKGNPMVSPHCPPGSVLSDDSKSDSTCVFLGKDGKPSSDCASFALGTEGTLNLGGAISSFSPTTNGGLDFLFSLGGLAPNPNNGGEPLGDLAPIANGATLSLTGGAEANPLSTCVNKAVLARPTGIPTPDELIGNTVKNWPASVPGPHFGLALSEDYANYALGGIYNSGLLCLQIGTDQVAQLTTNTVGLLIASMKTLPLQKATAPLALSLKPTQPPTVTFGNGTSLDKDPTMLVDLKGLGIDIFVWSSDRYIRAFTISLDLGVPVNLAVSKEGLTPQLDKINVTNSKVTNSQLLKEDPKTISDGIEAVISGAVGQALGGLKPINLSSALGSLGFALNIPDSVKDQGSPGLQKLTKGDHHFLGVFAGLAIAPPATPSPVPYALVHHREIAPEGLRIATMTKTNGPVIHLGVGSSIEGAQAVEYTYQVDHGFWHPWQKGSTLAARDEVLRLQGKHTIQVKSRQVGVPSSESDAVSVPVTMDVDPPALQLHKQGAGYSLKAVDQVALDEELSYRFAVDGAWSAWQQYHDGVVIPAKDGALLKVEVKDSEENIGSISQEIRGKLDTTGKAAAAGCGCSVPGTSSGSLPLGGLAIAGVLAYLRAARRRRLREIVAGVAVLCVAGSWTGCSCSKDSSNEDTTTPPPDNTGGSGGTPAANPCLANDECVTLVPGLIGSYSSAAAASDGTIWVSGYNEADFAGEVDTYGDLVVGKYNADKGEVAWDTIDGLDDKEEVNPKDSNTEGWRHGKQNAGDDVGLWTSLTVGDGDKPQVAYFDVTHGALKFASFDGTKWTFHTVQQKAQSSLGRYAKMVQVAGKPVVAYLTMEPGSDGFVVSGVRVARAKVAVPAAATDWQFEDVFLNKATPCRAAFCATGTKCSAVSGKCEAPAKGCTPKCSSDQECFTAASGPACSAVVTTSKIEDYPSATGLYVAAALDPTKKDIGLVFYDRLRGNLYQATKAGGAWTAQIIDGQTGDNPGTDTGDVGIGASLAIDSSGTWHVAYVDGINESLKYMKIMGGTAPQPPEVIDDGRAPGAMQAGADRSLVGDDSSITVVNGKITVAYQDATNGQLRVAVPPSTNGVWNVKAVKQDGKFAGFFSAQVLAPNGTAPQFLNYWRTNGTKTEGNVSVVSP